MGTLPGSVPSVRSSQVPPHSSLAVKIPALKEPVRPGLKVPHSQLKSRRSQQDFKECLLHVP